MNNRPKKKASTNRRALATLLLLAVGACLAALLLPAFWGPAKASLPDIDDWDVATIQGQRIGRLHTTVRHVTEGGKSIVKVAMSMQMTLKRFDDTVDMSIESSDTETPDGQLIDFESATRSGATPRRTTGKVVGNRLEMQIESEGLPEKQSLAWPSDAGGLLAEVLSLRAAPMKPGERRTIRHLNFDGQLSTTELTAGGEEQIELWNGSRRLLKIDSVERPPDVKGAIWTDSAGQTLKSWVEPLNMAYYRAPPEVAVAPVAANFDLNKATLIKVDSPIRRPHDTKWIRYRVRLNDGDPMTAFPACPSQEVKRIDEHTAEVTVRAVRPPAGNTSASANKGAADAPTDDDLKPNNFIQSDDPTIVAQAKEAVGGETDPWKQAVALEGFVHGAMKVVDFSQAFATAAEAARSRVGDCKAHAVYLAALARSLKIPARVAVGLVYMPQKQTFGGHMWTEVYVGGRWIGLDSTLGNGGIGGGHLLLAHSSLSGVSAYDVVYSMLPVIGRIKLEVLDYE